MTSPLQRRLFFPATSFRVFADHTTKYHSLSQLIVQRSERTQRLATDVRILDVGCGPGHLSLPMLEYFLGRDKETANSIANTVEYIGVDVDKAALEEIEYGLLRLPRSTRKRLGSYHFHNTPIKDLILSRRLVPPFDLILCSHVLYYVRSWRMVSRSLRSLLRPSGRMCVILTIPSPATRKAEQVGQKAKLDTWRIEPQASEYEVWLRSANIPFRVENHSSTLTAEREAEYNVEEAAFNLAMCFAFLLGKEQATSILEAARQLVLRRRKTFLLHERIFWLARKRTYEQ